MVKFFSRLFIDVLKVPYLLHSSLKNQISSICTINKLTLGSLYGGTMTSEFSVGLRNILFQPHSCASMLQN